MYLFIGLCLFMCLGGIWTVSKKEISHLSRKSAETIFLFVSFLLLVVICGFRALNVGNDTPMYVRFFNRLSGLKDISMYSWRFEFAYRLFNCLIAQFFSSAHALLICAAVFTIGLIFKFFKKVSVVPAFSVLMFLGLTMYYSTLSMMRQYLAIAVICHAILALMEKKRFRFVLLTIIGGLFHTSGFIVLGLLIVSLIPYNKNRRFLYIFLGLLFSAGFSVMVTVLIKLMPRYTTYLYGDTYYLQGKMGSVIRAVIYGLLFWIYDYLYNKYGEDTEKNKIMYFCGLIGFFITFISIQGAILSRIASYFNIVFCVSVPTALSWIPDRKKKYLWAAAILIGAFAFNFIVLIFRSHWTGVIPYYFWNS